MQKKYLCSFGDMRLNLSALRYYQQALNMNVFDDIFIYNECSLNLNFRNKMKDKMYINAGGGSSNGLMCFTIIFILSMILKV